MALTRDFRETVQARAKADPAFRAGLYQEAVQCMLDGELATARILLRDFVNATVGFAVVAGRMGVHEKSLMRMQSLLFRQRSNAIMFVSQVRLHAEAAISSLGAFSTLPSNS